MSSKKVTGEEKHYQKLNHRLARQVTLARAELDCARIKLDNLNEIILEQDKKIEELRKENEILRGMSNMEPEKIDKFVKSSTLMQSLDIMSKMNDKFGAGRWL